jgi:hypothetical protein
MKKILIIVAMLTVGFTACNRNAASTAIPEDVLNSFSQRYPTATEVKWDMDDELYEAKFKIGDEKMEAIYNSNGDLVRVDN